MRFLTLIACFLIATPALAQEMHKIRSITVNGMAQKKVVPDEAHLTVNLNSTDMKLATAKTAHDAKLKKLLAIVDGMGIDEKKVRTQHSSVQPMYDYNDGQQVFRGYRVNSNLDITVEDTKKLGDLMDKITAAGFEKGARTDWGGLLNMYYTISNPEEVRDSLLAEAIGNAREKAERMAKAGGADLGGVWQINESGTMHFPPPMPMMAMARAEMGGGAVADKMSAPPAGEQELQANVTVTFELKD